MTSIVDRLNEFRGTRPAQAISVIFLLGLGLYNLFFESGPAALGIGVVFLALGLFIVYKLFWS